MGLLQRLTALVAPRRKMTIDQWFDAFGASGRTATGLTVTQISAMQSSAVMACVAILSRDFAKLPWHVMRSKSDGSKEIAKDHPIERLLQKPNSWQTAFEFKEQMQAAIELRGNAYACIIRDRFGAEPTSLVPVNPDRVWLYEAPDGSLFYQVARQRPHDIAVLKSLPLMVPAEDMLHVRWLSVNGLWGLSKISIAREAFALGLAQQEHAGRFAGNGAALGGMLMTDKKLEAGVAQRLSQSWQDNYAGLGNAGKTAVLEEGVKFERMGMSSVDAEFIAARGQQVEEIARYFHMPLHKLGVSGAAGGATLAALDQDYFNNTIGGIIERWEPKLNDTFGLDGNDYGVVCDVTRFLRADQATRYAGYRVGIVGGFLKVNEARALEGLPKDPDGDTLLQPTNMAPLGWTPPEKTVATPGSDTSGAPASGGDGDSLREPSTDDAKALQLPALELQPLTLNLTVDAKPGPVRKTGKIVRHEDGSASFEITESEPSA